MDVVSSVGHRLSYDNWKWMGFASAAHGWTGNKGVSLQYLLYHNLKQQVNGQSSFKAKDNGQAFLVDDQSYANKVVHKTKQNKVKGQDKVLAKVSGQSQGRF